MEDRIFPRGLCKFFSYLSAFTLGLYTYGSLHGHPVEWYRWFITSGLGLAFYLESREYK